MRKGTGKVKQNQDIKGTGVEEEDEYGRLDQNQFSEQGVSKMATAEQKRAFISMCSNLIRENYSGDPLALEAFLDKIELVKELADDNLTTTLVIFVKSKLEGKAREALPEGELTISIDDIKTALGNRIRPENSKIIAGKIAALKVRGDDYFDFAKKAEELADALKRSLVMEGVTLAKAHEMAIERTVGVCRLNARSTLVKSILASTSFSDPKDVVAKLIVEQTNEADERQVLAFQSRNYNSNFSNRNKSRQFNSINFNRRGYRRGHNSSRGFGHHRGSYNNHYRDDNYFNRGGSRTDNSYKGNNRNGTSNRGARALLLNAEFPQQEMFGDIERQDH